MISAVCILIFMISGCSAVFKAGVSGTVRDADSLASPKEGISNMAVYAYTNESARNTDLSQWQADNSKIGASSSYVGRTTTANDGTFTISRLVWETTSPAFGKTADYRDIFLTFHHDDYGLKTNKTTVTIVSDSTNTNAVNEAFSKVNQIIDLQLTIENVIGSALGQAVSVKVTVPQGAGVDPKMYQTMINSAGTISVAYPKSLASAPHAKIEVSLNGSTWIQCDKAGVPIDFANTVAPLSESPTLEPVYMKNTRLNYPNISGQVMLNYVPADDSLAVTNDDGMIVWLGYRDTLDGKIKLFTDAGAETITISSGDGANGSVIRHGLFSGLGNGMTWEDTSYTTTHATKEVYVIFDENGNKKLDAGDRYLVTTIRSDRGNRSLGSITTGNTKPVDADDL